jgi:hypothetical protein
MNVVTEITGGVVHHFMMKPWTEEEMLAAMERAVVTIDGSD